jgi:hypothetical protein
VSCFKFYKKFSTLRSLCPQWLKILSIPSILSKNFYPVTSPAIAIWYNWGKEQ